MAKQQSEVTAFEAWLTEAKRLRTEEAVSTAAFFEHLQAGETNENLWRRGGGFANFAEAIQASNLCKPSRYLKFKDAVARIGIERVRAYGVDAAELILTIPHGAPSRREPEKAAEAAVLAENDAFIERNHTPPSEQQARAILRKHYEPPPRAPREMSADQARIVELTAMLAKERAALAKEREALAAERAKSADLRKRLVAAEKELRGYRRSNQAAE